jgi:hypothetical protein
VATVTAGVHTASTSNVSSYASASFTPAANDLLVVLVTATATVTNPGTCTSSIAGITFSPVVRSVWSTSANTVVSFVSNQFVPATSQTVTYDCTGDAATGAIVVVLRVAGLTRTGTSAIVQSAVQTNGAAAATPAPAFSASANTNNPCIGFYGSGTSSTTKNSAPASWTEVYDLTGYASPTTGTHVISRNSGFTGTTVTWGGASASVFGAQIIELNTADPDGYSLPIQSVTAPQPQGWPRHY